MEINNSNKNFEKMVFLGKYSRELYLFQIVFRSKISNQLTLYFIMSQNGQTHFKNLAAFAARFLKCAWPLWDITH